VRTTLLSLLVGSAFAVASASGYQRALSPDHRFEAYTTAHYPNGTGMRLFLRAAGSSEAGVLLRENSRWIRATWSPDSRFLALIDGSDGHVTDVFVYRVLSSIAIETKASYTSFQSLGEIAVYAHAPRVVADLWYHTPNPWTPDVRWDVAGWDTARSTILLTKRTLAAKPARVSAVLSSPSTHK
jgi:hypothetical protein